MNRVKLSVRVPHGQEVMIRRIADERGLTRYQALSRVIEAGLMAMNAKPIEGSESDFSDTLACIEARLSAIESVADRSLFTASAAYAYSRRAALRNDSDADTTDAVTSESARAAYRRQRALAAEAIQ